MCINKSFFFNRPMEGNVQVNNSSNSEYNMRIWRGAINADKHARYYSYRANAMKLWSMGLTFVVLISSSGAILSLMGVWNMVLLSTILYAIVALATIVNFVYDFSFQAAAALIIRNQCRLLAVEWEKIWNSQERSRHGGKNR